MASPPSSPESCDLKGGDKAGRNYWDKLWENHPLPPAMDPSGRGLDNYPCRKFHECFQSLFKTFPTRGSKLLEVGCAQSVYLPYFSKYFGFEVSGLDRSEIGCARARTILEREGVTGELCCADLFSPPQHLLESFHVVTSFGVVEHFEDSVECVKAMANFLRPGGRIITIIPNLAGILGTLQKMLARTVYDIHVPLDRERLSTVHKAAGLKLESCEYFLFTNLCILNIESWTKGIGYDSVTFLLRWISKSFWLAEAFLPFFKPNRWTSPYIQCVAEKLRAELR